MCQCVIYRGTCFLWRFSWPHKTQSRVQGRNQRALERARPAAFIESGKNKRSPLHRDAPDGTSHVVVIFTTLPLDCVAFFVRNHFDVRRSFRVCSIQRCRVALEIEMFLFLCGKLTYIMSSTIILPVFPFSHFSFFSFLCNYW